MFDQPVGIVVSCEHAGNRVPAEYRSLFRGARRALASHRGWDSGAIDLARVIAPALDAPLVATTVSRLVVECNRSLGHPRLFSEFTRTLPREEKQVLLDRHYHPHRGAVEAVVRSAIRTHGRVVHVGVHTFAPVLDGTRRTADVGLLYDPRRELEVRWCEEWMAILSLTAPGLRVRRNYPYRGASDGLTSALRRRFPAGRYLGIELEVNQALRRSKEWGRIMRQIAASLRLLTTDR
ncbi:MAG TPA: N-formylglutamate amidohydrolase [Candidatus Krumholzibacteria bacterium]